MNPDQFPPGQAFRLQRRDREHSLVMQRCLGWRPLGARDTPSPRTCNTEQGVCRMPQLTRRLTPAHARQQISLANQAQPARRILRVPFGGFCRRRRGTRLHQPYEKTRYREQGVDEIGRRRMNLPGQGQCRIEQVGFEAVGNIQRTQPERTGASPQLLQRHRRVPQRRQMHAQHFEIVQTVARGFAAQPLEHPCHPFVIGRRRNGHRKVSTCWLFSQTHSIQLPGAYACDLT